MPSGMMLAERATEKADDMAMMATSCYRTAMRMRAQIGTPQEVADNDVLATRYETLARAYEQAALTLDNAAKALR